MPIYHLRKASLASLLGGMSVLAFTIAQPGTAHAEDDASAGPASEQAGAAIVVTATRRQELAKDVPVAVTAIGGEKLDVLNSSGLDIRFLSARTPSLLIESSFGRTFPRFYIRGLGNTDFDPNSAQPVSVVYDEVALESPMLKSFPVFDLASVEVLRGPQGTLFGRNTPAGVVKLNSARPTDHFTGYVSGSLASYGTANVEGAVSGPLGGGFSARVSGLMQHRDDWVTNTATTSLAPRKLEGYTDVAGRLQIAYEGGDFKALANVHARDLDGTPRLFRAGIIQQGSNRFVDDFDVEKIAIDGLASQSLKAFGANLNLEYSFPGLGTLHSITAYERVKVESTGDIDGGNIYAFPPLGLNVALFPVNTGGTTKPEEFSQEVRFETEQFGKVRAQIGAYYFRQTLDYSERAFDTSGALIQNVIHDNVNRNFGLFASGEFEATDRLTLRSGVRYSSDKKKDVTSGLAQLPAVTLPLTMRVKGDNVSWDFSATYKATDDINLYGRFATGYLGPAIQDRVNFFSLPTAAEEQTTISGEAGIKGQLLDKAVSFDLTGYYFRTKNLQLTAVGGATNSAQLLNADKAIGYGVEFDMQMQPTPQLRLTAGASYNFTEIQDDTISVGVCGSGVCTVTDPLNSAGRAIIDGNPLPQAPRWVANWTARYGVPVGDLGEVYVYTDWAYRSEVNYFLYSAKEFRGRASLIGGLKLGFEGNNDLGVAVFARNITNQIRIESAIDFNNLTGMVSEPRIIGLELRKGF